MNWPCFWKPPGFSYKIGAALDTIPNLKAVDQQVINLQLPKDRVAWSKKAILSFFAK